MHYRVTVFLEDMGAFPTFKDAFKVLYEKVHANEEGISEMLLYEATWIHDVTEALPIMFQHCLEAAHSQGWLTKDGKLTY